MKMTAEAIKERMAAFPMTHKAGDNPLCCVSTIGKGLKFDIDQKSNKADILAVFNTSDIDSDDEVVMPEGLDPAYFRANGKLFADHIYSSENTIGFLRALKLAKADDGRMQWRARVGIHSTDLGRDIMTIAQESGQFGFSSGFWPTDYGDLTPEEVAQYSQGKRVPRSIVRTGEWFETSATPFPCNVNCQGKLVIASEAEDQSKGILDDLLTRGMIQRATAKHYGLEDAERRSFAMITPGGLIRGTKPI